MHRNRISYRMRHIALGLLVLCCCMGCQYSGRPWRKGVAVPRHLYSYSPVELRNAVKAEGYEGEHPEYYKFAEDAFNDDFEFLNVGRNASGTLVSSAGLTLRSIFSR